MAIKWQTEDQKMAKILILTQSFDSPSKIPFKRGVTCHYLNELKNGSKNGHKMVIKWRPEDQKMAQN